MSFDTKLMQAFRSDWGSWIPNDSSHQFVKPKRRYAHLAHGYEHDTNGRGYGQRYDWLTQQYVFLIPSMITSADIGDASHAFEHNEGPSDPIQTSYPYEPPGLNTYTLANGTLLSGAEYSVACPNRCGAVLTGVHADGNLTRHLKTQACAASGRAKVRYPCPIQGCVKEYARSDGLKVHMRKQHGAPPPMPKNGSSMVGDIGGEFEDDDR
ncbi:hypothetical protein EK21DRAFT_102077 [Setomelanomma holmii]|uniref:C2H2-type domain-containing protein n=1 Tax=Setomelanomma holmii TaxID=210430 RepID=A0A9P4LLL9_9PLEO|nr:hypothetical protein EK21DRAFT_102077 [Setomelanomma holmii]